MSTPSGPFQGICLIGGQSGGNPFSTCNWVQGSRALVVKALDVWYNSAYLRGIQVTYSDERRSTVYGTSIDKDKHASIVFAPGERVTSLTLWGNGSGTRTGRIRLTTNGGHTLDVGKDTSGQTAYDIDIGSGILVGMMGRSGADIDQLGAIFLRSAIARVAISDITYDPDLKGTDKGIHAVALSRANFTNPADSSKATDWNFNGNTSRTQSSTYSETSSNTYGASVDVEVSAEVFGIGAKASGGFEWQHQSSQTTGFTTSDTIELAWGLSGTLDPGESCTCTALVQRGEGSTHYNAKVVVTLEDNTTNTFTERGRFQNVAYTQVDAKVNVQKRKVKVASVGNGEAAEFARVLAPGGAF